MTWSPPCSPSVSRPIEPMTSRSARALRAASRSTGRTRVVLAARTADIVGGPPNTTMASRFTGMGVLCHRERPRDNWPDYTGRSLGVTIRLLPRVGRTASAAAHACLTNCPWGRLRLLEGLKVRRAGLAGGRSRWPGYCPGPGQTCRFGADSGWCCAGAGDAGGSVAAVADLGGARASGAGIPLSWSSDVTVPAASRGPAGPEGPEGPLGPRTGGCAW